MEIKHVTKHPRTSDESTVEHVKLCEEYSGRDGTRVTSKLIFERIAECMDVWQFIERKEDGEVITDYAEAFDPETIKMVLTETPCVEIRVDATPGLSETIAELWYTDKIRPGGDEE